MSPTLTFAAESGEAAVVTAGWLLRNAWIFPAIPFCSFLITLFFGKRLPQRGSPVGVAALALTFVLGLAAAGQWISYSNRSEDAAHAETEHALVGASAGTGESAAATAAEDDRGATTEEEDGEVHTQVGEAADEEEHASVAPVESTRTWWQSGGIHFEVGTLVDGLAIMMIFVVSLVSLLVHIYSTDYVHGDIRYTHYFAFLSLFTASMLGLIVSQGIVQFITCWELVGLCSFALIGHWWEEQANSDAALKAFLTNRVGDMGLLIGMIVLFFTAGDGRTFSIVSINQAVVSGTVSHTAMTVAALCLLAAVMSKSGQFFLHTWLPDAMAGPTPVSALIHAATMVVAGVYMVARLYPVFWDGLSIAGSSFNMMVLVGAVTTLVGGSLAFVQRDIKRVLAYSTVSQLGYMVMALGCGAWTAAVFHLFTHAFFKACLFLGSGSVSHACNHSFDMKKDMGGLRKRMPITHATFLIGTLALAGFPLFAGFWSKDEILAGTGGFNLAEGANGSYHVFLVIGLLTAGMTAAYMTRCYWLTFLGEWRGGHDHDTGHDTGHQPAMAVGAAVATGHDAHAAGGHDAHGHGEPHESGPRITGPLVVLATLTFLATFANIPEKFSFIPEGWRLRFEHYVEPRGDYFPTISHAEFAPAVAALSLAMAAIFSGVAIIYYRKVRAQGAYATELAHGPTTRNALAAAGYRVLENKFYLDWLYQGVIVAFIKGPLARGIDRFNQVVLDGIVDGAGINSRKAGDLLYRYVDQAVVDGAVNASGLGASETGGMLRRFQTGRIQQYAALMFGAAALLAGVLVIAVQ